MLTFLRKIRKSLLDSGSTRRYILYAIGEIALVVIGILIALQINNWNEWRKDRLQEAEILITLKNSTELNLAELRSNHQRVSLFVISTDSIIAAMNRREELSQELTEKFPRALLTGVRLTERMNMSGYTALEKSGFDILESKPLKLAVIELYETQLPQLERQGAEWADYLMKASFELLSIGAISHDDGYRPRDIYATHNFDYLQSVISLRRHQKIHGLARLEECIELCESLLEVVDSELERR